MLGDCVYFNGQVSQYYAQYYRPYEHYLCEYFTRYRWRPSQRPIFAEPKLAVVQMNVFSAARRGAPEKEVQP